MHRTKGSFNSMIDIFFIYYYHGKTLTFFKRAYNIKRCVNLLHIYWWLYEYQVCEIISLIFYIKEVDCISYIKISNIKKISYVIKIFSIYRNGNIIFKTKKSGEE